MREAEVLAEPSVISEFVMSLRSAIGHDLDRGATHDDLVTSHAGLDLDGPDINAAGHALDFVEALLTQPLSDSHTATAMMAMHDNLLLLVSF